MDIQQHKPDEAVSDIKGECSVMDNPLWMLVPWAVFALAAGLKFWRLTSLFRKDIPGIPSRTERFRQGLERTWIKGQLTP